MGGFGVWFGAKLSKGAKLTSKGLVLGVWCWCYVQAKAWCLVWCGCGAKQTSLANKQGKGLVLGAM